MALSSIKGQGLSKGREVLDEAEDESRRFVGDTVVVVEALRHPSPANLMILFAMAQVQMFSCDFWQGAQLPSQKVVKEEEVIKEEEGKRKCPANISFGL